MSEHNTDLLRNGAECTSDSHVDEINNDGQFNQRSPATMTSWKRRGTQTNNSYNVTKVGTAQGVKHAMRRGFDGDTC